MKKVKQIQKTNDSNGLMHTMRTFSLSRRLRDDVDRLQREKSSITFELGKSTKKHKLLESKNKGMKDIEHTFFNGEKRFTQDKLTQALREEVRRLNDIVASQQEIIEKEPFATQELYSIQKPELVTSKNPIKFVRNWREYRTELNEYKKNIRDGHAHDLHFVLETDGEGITIERDGTKAFKSDWMKEHKTHIEVGGKLRRYYYLADIPAYLSPYVFFRLLTSGLPFKLSVFIEPASSAELLKKARQRLSVLEMQQNDRLKDGKIRDQQIDKNMEEVMSFIDELVHEAERGVVYSLYLELEAENEEELASLHKKLQNTTEAMDIVFNQYTFGHKKAAKNFLPFNTDHVQENRILQSTAAAYLMPFVSKQLNDAEGIFLGINTFNNSLVFADPFTSRNNNMNIIGVSGSGKSVTSKILMNRLYMRGTQIIVIDPEGEYVDLARNLGGEVIQFSRENGINPFYINSSNENDILDHISTLKTFFRFFIPEHHYDGALLDEKLIKLYDKSSPAFENLLDLLGDHPMRKDLAVLSEGSLRGVFNSTRTLELDNDVIVLDLQHLKKDEKRDPAIYLLTSLIWNLVNRGGGRRRMLFIDEAHKLLVDKDVAIFYRELVKQARKRNVGVVSITQDVEDFLHNEYGKAIITNSETKILLKQSYATLKEIGTIYPMTDQEKEQLGHLEIGEVVLFREGEHIRLNVHVLPHEQSLVFTSNTGHEDTEQS